MRNKRITERERRRMITRRERNGPDFDSRNARHAARFIPEGAKFNSTTGKEAANKRWEEHRKKKASQPINNQEN